MHTTPLSCTSARAASNPRAVWLSPNQQPKGDRSKVNARWLTHVHHGSNRRGIQLKPSLAQRRVDLILLIGEVIQAGCMPKISATSSHDGSQASVVDV